jgi:dephospho-CoA kinase
MTEARPYCIGLTGNIATGKSKVGEMLAALGAGFIDADKVAHRVMTPDGEAYDAVVAAFGDDILAPDGGIDRGKLGRIVFQDPDALACLERIVHPPVIARVNARIARSERAVMAVEAIKLLESGVAETYDAIWVTTCPETMQIVRLMQDRDLEYDEAQQRVRAQPPQAEKIARADVVIDTSGSLADTKAQVLTAWEHLPINN